MNQINLEKPDYFPLCSDGEYKILLASNFDISNRLPCLTQKNHVYVTRIKTLDLMLQEATEHSCRDKV